MSTEEEQVRATAIRMINRYGSAAKAMEIAYGYACGVWFEQTPAGKEHWLKVEAKIRELSKK